MLKISLVDASGEAPMRQGSNLHPAYADCLAPDQSKEVTL